MYLYMFGCESFIDAGEGVQAGVILVAEDDGDAMMALEIELVRFGISLESFTRKSTMVRMPFNPFDVDIPHNGCVLATFNIHDGDQRTGNFSDHTVKRPAAERHNPHVLPTVFCARALDVLALTERHAHWMHLKRDV